MSPERSGSPDVRHRRPKSAVKVAVGERPLLGLTLTPPTRGRRGGTRGPAEALVALALLPSATRTLHTHFTFNICTRCKNRRFGSDQTPASAQGCGSGEDEGGPAPPPPPQFVVRKNRRPVRLPTAGRVFFGTS